jgi:uncharacterized protein YjiS (DUF1127 family)
MFDEYDIQARLEPFSLEGPLRRIQGAQAMMTPTIARARTGTLKHSGTPLFGRLTGSVSRLWSKHKTRRLLMNLDDHMLRDIGLSRGDIAFGSSRSWLTREHQ